MGGGIHFTLLGHCAGWVKRLSCSTVVGFADTEAPQHIERAGNKRTQQNEEELLA